MKRLFTILAALALVLLCAVLLPTEANAASVNDITFVLNGETNGSDYFAYINNASATGELVFPATYKGKPVIGVGSSVECPRITGITIPSGVTKIEPDAFEGFSGLTSISIPNSVTEIGANAFAGCTSLTSITIPDSVAVIGSDAFVGCRSLTSITVSDSVTCIYGGAFRGCNNLKEVHVSDIAAWCKISFYNDYANPLKCEATLYLNGVPVTNLVIPNSIASIGERAFVNYSGLTSVTIPNGVKSIGDSAFSGCANLISVDIPDSLNSIGSFAFSYCDSLTNITIPSGIKSFGESVFSSCERLASVRFDDGVTHIPSGLFNFCSQLTSITIPNSVTSIDSSAFFDLSIEEVHISDIAAWCKISFGNYQANPLYNGARLYVNGDLVRDIVIPHGVTSIGDYAFIGCNNLTGVTISDNSTIIGDSTFKCCSNLKAIIVPSGVDTIEANAFANCKKLQKVYFRGSQADWDWIIIESGNDYLTNAELVLNFTGDTIPCDHSWNAGVVTKQPNCKETGVKTYTCSVCGGTKTEDIAKTGSHSYGAWTRFNNTTHKRTCSGCQTTETKNHSWSSGKCNTCGATTAYIVTQPVGVTVANGSTAKVSVTATGNGLKYQWYFTSNGTANEFMPSSNTTATYSTTMDASRAGRQVYCVITDQYGNSVRTNTVTLKMQLRITKQPASTVVNNGATAKTTVTAQGEGLKYQWYYTANGSSTTFMKSSYTTATYSTSMDGNKAGRRVYCVITDRYGNTVTTNTVTLGMRVCITKQPVSAVVSKGATATATVTAKGEWLAYQWYYTANGSSSTFMKSSITSATYFTTMDASKAGRKVYCVITDKYGNTVTTNTVSLGMKVAIAQQPASVVAANGATVKTTVTAQGEGLKYQWYYTANGSSNTFMKSSYTTATYSTTIDGSKAGRRVYCVITDRYGNTMTTNAVTLGMNVVITKQPASVTVAKGKTAAVTVTAKGEGLKYQWYYTAGGNSSTFTKSSITSATYFTTMDAAKSGRRVYCVITDKYGNTVKTSTATLRMR